MFRSTFPTFCHSPDFYCKGFHYVWKYYILTEWERTISLSNPTENWFKGWEAMNVLFLFFSEDSSFILCLKITSWKAEVILWKETGPSSLPSTPWLSACFNHCLQKSRSFFCCSRDSFGFVTEICAHSLIMQLL